MVSVLCDICNAPLWTALRLLCPFCKNFQTIFSPSCYVKVMYVTVSSYEEMFKPNYFEKMKLIGQPVPLLHLV